MTASTDTHGRLIRVEGERLGHVPGFDGIRGVFILLVVLYHAEVLPFIHGMPIIIDWFFVASGFLITTLLLDETKRHGKASLRNFYTRRVLRLFPAMYAFIGVYVIIMIVARTVAPAETADLEYWWVDALAAATYSYNIVAAIVPDTVTYMIGHTWSLSVEEQFYFLWPLILLGVLAKATRRADRKLIIGSVLFVALFFFIRFKLQWVVVYDGFDPVFVDQEDPTWQGIVYRIAASRPDMIVYGCLTALVARMVPRPVPDAIRRWLAILGPLGWAWFVAVLIGMGRIPGFEMWGGPGYQIALLFLAPITLDTYFRQKSFYNRFLCFGPFRWLGLRAYGIYLWHVLPILILAPAIFDSYGAQKLALSSIATVLGIGAGLLSYRYIERPFLAMKDRFSEPPGAKGTVPAEAPAESKQQ